MSDFYSATIFLSVFIMIIMDMLRWSMTKSRRFTRSPYW